MQGSGEGKTACKRIEGGVECGVKGCRLQQCRMQGAHRVNQPHILRLMQGRQRGQFFDARKRSRINAYGPCEYIPAMYHSVPGAAHFFQRILLSETGKDMLQRGRSEERRV